MNVSEVETIFTLEEERDDAFEDHSFKIFPKEGLIPSKKSFILWVEYEPKIPDFISYLRLKVKSVGGNSETIEIFGSSARIAGKILNKTLNFSQLRVGDKSNGTLTILNEYSREMRYEILNLGGCFWSP